MRKYVAMAMRNLGRQKRRTLLLGGAVTFGVFIIAVLNSFTNGLVASVTDNFADILAGHVYVSGTVLGPDGNELRLIRNGDEVLQMIEELDVEYRSVSVRSTISGSLIFGSNSIAQIVEGVNWEQEEDLAEGLTILAGSRENLEDPRSITLTRPMADRLQVEVGEEILVRLETITGQQNVGEFVLAAITADAGVLGAISSYAHIEYVNELLNVSSESFQRLSISLPDIQRAEPVARRIHRRLAQDYEVYPLNGQQNQPGGGGGPFAAMFGGSTTTEESWEGTKFRVRTINDQLSSVESLVSALNWVGFGILALLLLITMVGITNTYRMVMLERTKEIGTIRALGMQRGGVRGLFLLEAGLLAVFAAVAGLVIARIAAFGLSFLSFANDSAFYLFTANGSPAFVFQVPTMIGYVVFVLALCLLAALFPANRAAGLNPAQALRTEK